MTIQSFRCRDTESLYRCERVARWVNIERAALRKLTQLVVSSRLDDLRSPPGNRLEVLKGDRAGQYSIRINDQWRICFVWADDGAHDVEIVDYH
jgi:proteic killer suppression protein